jgi:PAS domain S-box-containing protein
METDMDIDTIDNFTQELTLLYVEDNEDAAEVTTMLLEDLFDTIIVAKDGVDALDKFHKYNIHIILTDINMPNMNGLELARKIKEIDFEMPVILLSAHNESKLILESIDIGVDGYILKPIDLEQLSQVIRKIAQKLYYKFQSQANEHLLKTYQHATNESALVSKTDTRGIITYANESFCKVSGYTKEELIGANHNIVRHPDNPPEIYAEIWDTIKNKKQIWKGIIRNRAKNGKSYYVNSLIMPILDLNGNIIEYISLRHDITEIMNPIKQLKDAIKNAKDPLLLYMRLEKYDEIEDFFDDEIVEQIQVYAKKHLEKRFSEIFTFDIIYHLGNGECAILLEKKNYIETGNEKKFIEKLIRYQNIIRNDKIDLGEIEYDISIMMSVVYVKEKMLESAKLGIRKLLRSHGDFIVANNLAKREQEKAKKNMQTINMIKTAIKNSNIVSYFQPIVDNKSQEIVKYESLVRLIDENGKVLTPFHFLDTAKRSNYYTKITDIVLQHSFNILNTCKTDISINLSALDIEQESTRKKVLELLHQHKENASRIVFELLEDESVKNFDVVKEFITTVKQLGVKIAIDDFGAGYSNFERLLDYQPDILKIDGCLIRDIESSSYSLSAVKSIVTFAKEQGLETIAEFIENEDIFTIVKALGVDYSQGYYFGKPEPLDA